MQTVFVFTATTLDHKSTLRACEIIIGVSKTNHISTVKNNDQKLNYRCY